MDRCRCCALTPAARPSREPHPVEGFSSRGYRSAPLGRPTPVHGQFPGFPSGSGSKERNSTDAGFQAAAVLNIPCTRSGSPPYGLKKWAPSVGHQALGIGITKKRVRPPRLESAEARYPTSAIGNSANGKILLIGGAVHDLHSGNLSQAAPAHRPCLPLSRIPSKSRIRALPAHEFGAVASECAWPTPEAKS